MNLIVRIVALCMSPALVLVQCQAQITAVSIPETQTSAKAAGLQVRVIGTVAELPASTKALEGWAFQVTDETGAVVSNALVTVQLPDAEPSGLFLDGKSTASAFSDEIGRAQFPRIIWGSTPGPVTVRVTASRDGAHAGMLLEQKLISSRDSGAKQAVIRQADLPVTATPQASTIPQLPVAVPQRTLSALAEPMTLPPPVGELARPGVSIQQIGKGTRADLTPSMSITTTGASSSGSHHSVKKWVVLAALIGGGAAAAVLLINQSGKSNSSGGASNAPVTIGTPTITISH